MATLKQKNLAREIVNNVRSPRIKTASELLVSAGYDETTAAASPGRTIEQKGVKEELAKLGFDENTAKEVVATILSDEGEEARDRLKAAEMVFKVYGSFAPEKRITAIVNVEPTERIKDLAKKLNQ